MELFRQKIFLYHGYGRNGAWKKLVESFYGWDKKKENYTLRVSKNLFYLYCSKHHHFVPKRGSTYHTLHHNIKLLRTSSLYEVVTHSSFSLVIYEGSPQSLMKSFYTNNPESCLWSHKCSLTRFQLDLSSLQTNYRMVKRISYIWVCNPRPRCSKKSSDVRGWNVYLLILEKDQIVEVNICTFGPFKYFRKNNVGHYIRIR